MGALSAPGSLPVEWRRGQARHGAVLQGKGAPGVLAFGSWGSPARVLTERAVSRRMEHHDAPVLLVWPVLSMT